MKQEDAAKLLGLSEDITPAKTKLAYKRACHKYHPDKGGSTTMMQAINEAYQALKDFIGNLDSGNLSYPDELNDAINAINGLDGLIIEVCGAWVWVTGDTKKHAKALGKNGAGFFYASKKQAWYFRPDDWKSVSRGSFSMDDIRATHGTQTVKKATINRIGA